MISFQLSDFTIQIVLRSVHFIYRHVFEQGLLIMSRFTSDMSHLTLEVVNLSDIKSGENLLRGTTEATSDIAVSESGDSNQSLDSVVRRVSHYKVSSDSSD